MRAEQCMIKLLLDYGFFSVLDIGSGDDRAAKLFRLANKNVTTIDINPYNNPTWVGDFKDYPTINKFDCVWCSHVLEHQLNVGNFLTKILQFAPKVVAITVPPLKNEIVGGHYTLWNMGLLIYNMVMAGFDCNELVGIKQGYNISVITPVKPIPPYFLEKIKYGKGDIKELELYFPLISDSDSQMTNVWHGFNGDIKELRWYSDEVVYENQPGK